MNFEKQNQETEKYEFDSLSDDEVIKHYQPKYLARGGGRLVYEIPDHPDVVVKAEMKPVKKVILKIRETNYRSIHITKHTC